MITTKDCSEGIVDPTKIKARPVNRKFLLFYRVIIAPILCLLFTGIGALTFAQSFPQATPEIGRTMLGQVQNIVTGWGAQLGRANSLPAVISQQVGDAVQPQMDLATREIQARIAVAVPKFEAVPLEGSFELLQKAAQSNPFGLGALLRSEPIVLNAERTVIQANRGAGNVQGVKTRMLASQEAKSFVDGELSYYQSTRDNQVVSETPKQKDTTILQALPAQMRLDGVKAGYVFLVEEYLKVVKFYLDKNDNENKLILPLGEPQ